MGRTNFLVFLSVFSIATQLSAEPVQPSTTEESVAEVIVYDSLIRQLSVSGNESGPRSVGGHTAQTTTNFWVRPVLNESTHQIQFTANLGLDSSSVSSSSQSKRRVFFSKRKGDKVDGATVYGHTQANFSLPVYLTADGMYPGELYMNGYSTNSSIQPFSNRGRIGSRISAGITTSMAAATVNALAPDVKQAVISSVNLSTRQAVAAGNGAIMNQLKNIAPYAGNSKAFPFKTALSSQPTSSKSWGAVRWGLKDTAGANPRDPKPELSQPTQPAGASFIHEDAITKTLTPQLAGKQMKLSDLDRILCDGKFGKILDICEKENRDKAKKSTTSVLFAEVDPIKVKFENDEIKITLNVQHQIHNKGDAPSDKILTEPTDSKKLYKQGHPFSVEMTYKLMGNRAERTSMRIRARDSGKPVEVPKTAKEEPAKVEEAHASSSAEKVLNFFGGVAREVGGAVADSGMNLAERMAIAAAYEEKFKKEVKVDPISIPLQSQMPAGGGAQNPSVIKAGTLFPLEMKAEKGWLAVSQYLCPEDMTGLGIQTVLSKNPNGQDSAWVSSLPENSPAFLAGVRPGDHIFFFRTPTDEMYERVKKNTQALSKLIQKAASSKEFEERKIQIYGVNAKGEVFERTITACPAGFDHRKGVKATMDKMAQVK